MRVCVYVYDSQAFRAHNDGTLLRPSRPISTVDSALLNATQGLDAHSVRATHSAIPLVGSGTGAGTGTSPRSSWLHTHYVVAFGTRPATALQGTDLYPAPSAGVRLGVRQHVFEPGAGQSAGCEAGSTAAHGCLGILGAGQTPTIPASTGGEVILSALHEPLPNGAYLLGELSKFVHVSPQRFASIMLGGGGSCGCTAVVLGAPNEVVSVVCVDPRGVVRVASVTVGTDGMATVVL